MSSEWMQPLGSLSPSPHIKALNLANGNSFVNTPPFLFYLYLFGCLWALFSKNKICIAFAIAGIFNFLIHQDTWHTWFFHESFSKLFHQIRLIRFTGYAKLFAIVLTGGLIQYVVVQQGGLILRAIKSFWRKSPSALNPFWHLLLGRLVLLALLVAIAILVLPIVHHLVSIWKNDASRFPLATSAVHPNTRPAIEKTINTIRELEPNAPGVESFFLPVTSPRIGIRSNTYESSIPFRYGFGIVPPPYMPTMLLYTRSMWRDDAAARYSQMKYFLGRGNKQYVLDVAGMKPLQEIDGYVLFENSQYSEKPFHILGDTAGEVKVVSMQTNSMILKCSGFEKPTWIRFPVSRYRKWKAVLNNDPVSVQPVRLQTEPPSVERFIAVQAQNGTLKLQYENEWINTCSSMISGLSLIALIAFPFVPLPVLLTIQRYLAVIILSAALLVGIIFGVYAAQSSSDFWFLGVLRDKVGTTEMEHDRRLDLQSAMKSLPEMKGKRLQEVPVRIFDPMNDNQPLKTASSEEGNQWKLALNQYHPNTQRWEFVNLPQTIDHHLMIYMGNPYRDRYAASGTTAHVEFIFADGSSIQRDCTLPSNVVY